MTINNYHIFYNAKTNIFIFNLKLLNPHLELIKPTMQIKKNPNVGFKTYDQ